MAGATDMAKVSDRQAVRLGKAMDHADKRMETFRTRRKEAVREYVGWMYGTQRIERERKPLNMVYSLVQSLIPVLHLEPRAMFTSFEVENQWFATLFGRTVDRVTEAMDLGVTLDSLVMDALFGLGVAYSGTSIEGEDDAAEAFVDVIDLDDYLPDPANTDRASFTFEGHKFRMSFEQAMATDMLDRAEVERLGKLDESRRDTGKVADLSAPERDTDAGWIDEIELISVWVPSMRSVCILPGRPGDTEKYLSVVPMAETPYDTLSFLRVPSNSLPAALIPAVLDLHELMNTVARKMRNQARNQKNIGVMDVADRDDLATVQAAHDGDWVGLRNSGGAKVVSFGGIDASNYQAAAFFGDYFNRVAGNPDALGGLESQSGTLGQDQMLFANASQRIEFWRGQIRKFAGRLIERIARVTWEHPTAGYNLRMSVPGLGRDIDSQWSPDVREGEYGQYRIDIEAYGISSDSPAMRYRRYMDWVSFINNVGASQGVGLDMRRVADYSARLAGIPDGAGMLQSVEQPQQVQTPGTEGVTTVNMGQRQASAEPGSERTTNERT